MVWGLGGNHYGCGGIWCSQIPCKEELENKHVINGVDDTWIGRGPYGMSLWNWTNFVNYIHFEWAMEPGSEKSLD